MYHPQLSPTIGRKAQLAVVLALTAVATCAWSRPLAAAPLASAAPSPSSTPVAFAPSQQNLFSPLMKLAPPGPERFARAVDIFDRTLRLERKIAFHPELDVPLQRVREQLPPRQSTLIRAAALYSRDDISWTREPPDRKLIAVAGQPRSTDYLYSLASKYVLPEQPGDFAGEFELWPTESSDRKVPDAVIGRLAGQIYPGTFGSGAVVDALAAVLSEIHGDLTEPWDSAPGTYNHHDAALWARLERDLPAITERLKHYLVITNLIDEFSTPEGPVVLVNLDCSIKLDALKPYIHLWKFYRANAPLFELDSMIDDWQGHNWMHVRFDRGRIRWQFMLRDAMLTPFDRDLRPAGASFDLATASSGNYRTITSARVHKLGTEFGLADIVFSSDYQRRAGSIILRNRMTAPPQLIAPPVVDTVMRMIAGEFMRTLADGNGGHGLSSIVLSADDPRGGSTISAAVQGEFHYSPTLEFLARIGDSIADAHNQAVRDDERRLGEELFNAFVSDYNSARDKLHKATLQNIEVQHTSSHARDR